MNRQLYMGGGITQLPVNEMMVPRGQYGLGSLVKSITKPIKKAVSAVGDFASSDIGKLALLAAGGYYLGGGALFGGPGFSMGQLGTSLASPFKAVGKGLFGSAPLGDFATGSKGLFGSYGFQDFLAKTGASQLGISSLIPGKGTLLSAGLGFLGGAAAGGGLSSEQIAAGMKRNPTAVKQYLKQYYMSLNKDASEADAEAYAEKQTREYAANGGRIGFAMGNMPMGEPRKNQGGVMELDYRNEGGFVPVGIKEKADDVPAMLSKNEFVFTADAVRGAGEGDIEKGAQRLYNTMKTLENGGTV